MPPVKLWLVIVLLLVANVVAVGILMLLRRHGPSEGWFRDTLPTAPVGPLAILRLDGDMYESTIIALDSLYDRVVPGGFVIVDDYHGVEACRMAVHDFCGKRGFRPVIAEIDGMGVYWRVQ